MYLQDRRFNTLIAFVDGFNLGTGGRLLEDFSQWLQERTFGYVTNYHWQTIVAALALGITPQERWRDLIDEGFDARASDELLNQLKLFLHIKHVGDAGADDPGGSTRDEVGSASAALEWDRYSVPFHSVL
jgi:hypothetical protein